MPIRREALVRDRLLDAIRTHSGAPQGDTDLDGPIAGGSALTKRMAVRRFESALQSRLQDFAARRLKDDGQSF